MAYVATLKSKRAAYKLDTGTDGAKSVSLSGLSASATPDQIAAIGNAFQGVLLYSVKSMEQTEVKTIEAGE